MQNFRKYLPINSIEHEWGLYANTVGFTKIRKYRDYPSNREHPADHYFTWEKGRVLANYQIIFITDGEGILETTRKKYQLKAGSCFLLYPEVWHRYRPNQNTGWNEYWVGFNGSFVQQLMQKGIFSSENIYLDIGLNEEILSLFHTLIKTVQAAEIGHRQVISGTIMQLLALLNVSSKYKEDRCDNKARLISKAKFLLQESIQKPVNLEDIARELPMGYSKFRKEFKLVTGQSPNQYQLNLRLNRAKELLTSTDLTINEISQQTGFDSIFYFSKLFKKKNGQPPKNFRMNIN
ncbi:AraC family transcriptional regulator [Mucilaginibacter sp. SMC90]|uniref:AraC family transcriptional regulator n=1 Tax=Mucilaginibacter sp. SMC90 TaxID=2929803 RepID=UPI001FB3ACE8|nr:AraC family transcriptional regulator [Mucilaginibacter sp. SMC90]UOE47253.1 AraC family transcriptional regulator [Mucilaginibacter sp. SMC90]